MNFQELNSPAWPAPRKTPRTLTVVHSADQGHGQGAKWGPHGVNLRAGCPSLMFAARRLTFLAVVPTLILTSDDTDDFGLRLGFVGKESSNACAFVSDTFVEPGSRESPSLLRGAVEGSGSQT